MRYDRVVVSEVEQVGTWVMQGYVVSVLTEISNREFSRLRTS